MEFNEKQVQILESAEQLFADKGYSGTSVRDIAQDAGVNIAMISYYFGSKEKMMEALFEYRSGEMRIRMENLIREKELSPMEKLGVMVDEYVKKFWRNRKLHRIILREYSFSRNELLHRRIHAIRERQFRMMQEIVAQGQEQGVFRKDVDVPMLFATLPGITKHLIFSRKFFGELYGLRGDPGEQDRQLLERLRVHLKSILKLVLHEGDQ